MAAVDELPAWFFQHSPLSMDALKGPDAQYLAGALDMLTVIQALGLIDGDNTG